MVIMTLTRRQILLRAGWLCFVTLVLTLAVTPGVRTRLAVGDGQGPLTSVPAAKGKVAITFDVTWGTEELGKVLTILESHGARATFFVGGSFLSYNGEQIKRMANKGHEIGTLGQKIVDVTQLTEQEVVRELMASQSLIAQAIGRPAKYFRPPLGVPTEAVLRGANTAKLITVTHSVASNDDQLHSAADIAGRVLKAAGEGDIIHLTASDFAPYTAEALPQILAGLSAKGLTPVTLSELVDLSDRRGR